MTVDRNIKMRKEIRLMRLLFLVNDPRNLTIPHFFLKQFYRDHEISSHVISNENYIYLKVFLKV
jgi:hypothetical protein